MLRFPPKLRAQLFEVVSPNGHAREPRKKAKRLNNNTMWPELRGEKASSACILLTPIERKIRITTGISSDWRIFRRISRTRLKLEAGANAAWFTHYPMMELPPHFTEARLKVVM